MASNNVSPGASGSGGFLSQLWAAIRLRPATLIVLAILLTLLLAGPSFVSSMGAWPFLFLCDVVAVTLGVALGWAWIKADRMRVIGPFKQAGNLDQLGRFYSSVAMRSELLFYVTTAELAMRPRTGTDGKVPAGQTKSSAVDEARAMVSEYWALQLPSTEDQVPITSGTGAQEGKPTEQQSASSGGSATPETKGKPEEPEEKDTEEDKKKREEEKKKQEEEKKKRDEKKAQEETLKKILQPEYAIGNGVISNDDYNKLKDEYFAQSELSLGLILPMMLIVLGLRLTPQVGLQGVFWVAMCLALVPISGGLFWVGMERRHKYRLELKLLILGNWQRLQDAKKDAKSSDPSPTAIQKAIAKAIGDTGFERRSLNVKVDTKS
jgi:hypothetical protein